jgi:Domain of unknown function (DUF4349)/Putative zinc-finger
MSTSTHPIAPEEVMAFLDGELSGAGAQAVSNHLQQCAECNAIAHKFRATSHSLAQWSVPAAPTKLEESVIAVAGKSTAGKAIGKSNFFIRASFWTWKQWIVGIGAMAALLLLFVSGTIPGLQRHRLTKAISRVNDPEREQLTEKDRMVVSPLQAVPYTAKSQQQAVATGAGSGGGFGPEPRRGLSSDSNGPLLGVGDQVDTVLTLAPMIARVASLSIVTKDFAASRASLDAILARHRGYAAELSANTPENGPRSLQAALRIPAAELSSAVADLKMLGRVENESQSGEEVTQQHADLVARLKTSRETEQRFQAILQQRTGDVAQVLQVEEGIARVRGDIERMEAEQKNLEHRVEFASVNLQLTEEYKARLDAPAASISTRIHNAMVAGFKNVSETILGMLLFFFEAGPTMLLAALIFLAPAWLLWRRYRRALVSS